MLEMAKAHHARKQPGGSSGAGVAAIDTASVSTLRVPESITELHFDGCFVEAASLLSPWLQRLQLPSQLAVLCMPRDWHAPMPFDLPDSLTELRMRDGSEVSECYPRRWPSQLRILGLSSRALLSELPPLPSR